MIQNEAEQALKQSPYTRFIKNLNVICNGEYIKVEGTCCNYYTKQMANQILLNLVKKFGSTNLVLKNEILVEG